MEKIDLRSITEFYHATQNKRLVYHLALAAWLCVFLVCTTLLSLFVGQSTFYVTLVVSLPVMYGATHVLLLCFIAVPQHVASLGGDPLHTSPVGTPYSVASFGVTHGEL